MDIKFGKSTLTLNGASKGEAFINSRAAKDLETSSSTLGFTICGFLIKNEKGETVEHGYKTHKLLKEPSKISETLKKILNNTRG